MAVYLLHLDRPLSVVNGAQHYLGFAERLEARLAHHAAGTGARFTAVARERGIGWTLARTWREGDRQLERRLKRWKKARALCPVCKGSSRPGR